MSSIVLYLHVHQPHRIRDYSVFDTAQNHEYFTGSDWDSGWNNERVFRKVAEKSYYPMNRMLKHLLKVHPEFKVSLSITGTFIEQCEMWDPKLLHTFQELVATGRVEIVGETYQHSLAFFYSRREFEKQVLKHREKIHQIFGVTPTAFRNTELAYNNEVGEWAELAGYKAILAEGWDPVLGWRSPNFVYRPPYAKKVKLLVKNYRLSDDVAFRFSNKAWPEWPLTADKYLSWLEAAGDEPLRNLFMDYETFGEHQWEETGIFDFMKELTKRWIAAGHDFATTTEAATKHKVSDTLDMPHTVTWADAERDMTAWTGNRMQQEALRMIYDLEDAVNKTGDEDLAEDWRLLQTSDHFYYMCTKYFSDGDVHAYFSPYESPYDAFVYFMNSLRDIRWRISEHQKGVL
jgi:alpha-amylase